MYESDTKNLQTFSDSHTLLSQVFSSLNLHMRSFTMDREPDSRAHRPTEIRGAIRCGVFAAHIFGNTDLSKRPERTSASS